MKSGGLSKSNILKFSLIACLCAQSPFFSNTASSISDIIWDFSDEDNTQAAPPSKIQDRLSEKQLKPSFSDAPDYSDRVWDVDWHTEIVDVQPLEISSPHGSQQNAQQQETRRSPARHKDKPASKQNVFYSLDDKNDFQSELHPLEKALNSTSGKASSFHDSEDDDWSDVAPYHANEADISSVRSNFSAVIEESPRLMTLDEAAFEEDLTDDDPEKEAPPSPQEPTGTLGKKNVYSDPYSVNHTSESKLKGSRQVVSSKKSPYVPEIPPGPQKGIYGPPTSQAAKLAAPQEKANTQILKAAKGPKRIVEPHPDRVIAQGEEDASAQLGGKPAQPKTILIDYNNISIVEYIRFVSRITGKNFIFDESDLQFNVTIISEEPTTLENVMTALLQELRIHGLSLIEEGNNLIIHRSDSIQTLSKVNVDGDPPIGQKDSQLVTQVFKFNTLDPEKAATIIRPLLSKQALVEPSEETRHLIVTDLVTNIRQIALLFKSIDSPDSGLVIGQYVVKNSLIESLISLAKQIMDPIAKDQQLTFVPHPSANSIFVVSTPFLVERTLSVLQHIDTTQGSTRIYELEELKYKQFLKPTISGAAGAEEKEGKWEKAKDGKTIFRPSEPTSKDELPRGEWIVDHNKQWYYKLESEPLKRSSGGTTAFPEGLRPGEAPRGHWTLEPQGSWVFQLAPEETLQPARLVRQAQLERELPVGHIERTRFYIHKLQYRRGADIIDALQQIGSSLSTETNANADLAFAVQNTQWLESSNSLIITGTELSILKVKELIEDLDIPLRQVFIEMLILQTNITDSLAYGVDFGTRSGGGNTSTAQAFLGAASTLVTALDTTGVNLIPNAAASIARTVGFNMGIIGQRITHNGTEYASLGALVQALHTRDHTNILLNPKIITEDNKPAEIFVGVNIPFQTQSIVNNLGVLVTNNVEYRDVGTTLKITPLIGAGDIITLEIHQEVSTVVLLSLITGQANANQPSTRVNRTTTTVHVPDRHFVIISGMIDNEKEVFRNNLPCLGGVPLLGAAFSDRNNKTTKTNLMIFIRPQIIDTDEQFRTLTRQQQCDWKHQNAMKPNWEYEVDEGLQFLNIRKPCCNECGWPWPDG